MRALLFTAPLFAIAAGLAAQQEAAVRPFNQSLTAPSFPVQPFSLQDYYPEPDKPCISLVGPNSGIHQRRFERIRDANAWQALWELHAKGAGQGWLQAPRIDFKNYEVIAFFRGDTLNDSGEVVEAVQTYPQSVLIQFDSITVQTVGSSDSPNAGGGVASTPYGIWVIPRSSKPIAIEENVQELNGKPAQWQLQHQFPAAQDDGC